MKYTKFKISAAFLILFVLSGLVSCSKTSDDTAGDEVKEADLVNINNDDIQETDEDLLNVDYKEFYDELSPHGEWIEVKSDDIGVNLKRGSATGESRKSVSFKEIFGVKNAYADDVSFGAFFVWKPAPNLAVGITAGEPPVYQPYTNGQWIYTSNGWYFRAASQHEEITHHYGRWVYTPSMGWLWVPGRVWAPAWVDWREQDEYVAWAPVPPSVYIVNNVIIAPPVYEERYVIVERRYFIEPEVYRYSYKIHKHKHKVKITEWHRPEGIIVVNNTVINRGPDVTIIQNVTGRTYEPVIINHVNSRGKINYSEREYTVYSPDFKKVKKEIKVKHPVSKPKEFSDYHSASKKENERKYSSKEFQDNSGKNENKTNKNPGIERKYSDDKDMYNGKNNERKNNNKEYNNEKKNKNDNENKRRNDDRNRDSKQKEKIKENKGNDNKGNENKSKDIKKKSDNSPGKEKGNKKFSNDKRNNERGKEDKKKEGSQKKNTGKNKNKK